jgi:hypothetical protein
MTKRSYKKGLAIVVGLAVVVVGGLYVYATQATSTRDISASGTGGKPTRG